MVPRGLEPRTLRLLAVRSNQLSYETSGGLPLLGLQGSFVRALVDEGVPANSSHCQPKGQWAVGSGPFRWLRPSQLSSSLASATLLAWGVRE